MSYNYSDEMLEFLKRNNLYKEYNPKSNIKKVQIQKTLGCVEDAPRYVAAVKPTERRVAEYEKYEYTQEISYGIVVCIKNTNEDYLRQMIESILAQTYKKFTLYILDHSDKAHAYIANVCTDYDDGRIVYRKIRDGQTVCWDYFVCDYIVLMNEIDALSRFALSEITIAITEKNGDMLYTDSILFKKRKSNVINCVLRPDYAPTNLQTYNYIGDFCVFKRLNFDLTKEVLLDNASDSAYDIIGEQAEFAKNIVHIRKTLYFENIQKARKLKINKKAFVMENEPLVSIVIKSNNDIEKLSTLINSILMMTSYDNYEIVIVESDTNKADTLIYKYYKLLSAIPNIHFLRWKGEDSKTKIYNYATTKVQGDYLVFVDECLEITSYQWLKELLVYAGEVQNALVSAKVYKSNSDVIYAGATYYAGSKNQIKYETSQEMDFARNVSISSKFCFMIEKTKFFELGKFDEGLKNEMFIEDLSLKAKSSGYYNVYTPYAGVKAKVSRQASKGEDVKMFRDKWQDILAYDEFKEKY